MNTKSKNILVTGANGQLGNSLRDIYNSGSCPTAGTVFFTDVEELDITDCEAVHAFVADNDIDVVINCAAFTAVDRAESEAKLASRLNADAPRYLAEAVEKRGGEMIQVSTDYVFDGTACTPYTEDMPTSPRSVYGETKLRGEQAALAACSRTAVIRTAWLCSPYGKNFVKTMLDLGRQGKSLRVIFDQIGTPTFAADLAAAIASIVEHGVVSGVYHYSGEGAVSWYDFARTIHRLAGVETEVEAIRTSEYPTPAARPNYSVLDKSKIKQTYGITIPWWTDSLRDCLERIG